LRLYCLAAALCAIAGAVSAQTADGAPLYRSAFDGYRVWRADESGDWKRANDEMQRLGGHAGHLRGAAPSASPTPASKPPQKMQDKPAASSSSRDAQNPRGGERK